MSKKILITGKNSYVGTSFIKWMAEHEPETECVEISVRGNEWKDYDFSPFDSVLHVAGIAHVNSKKFTDEDYYNINTHLTVEVATKAKQDGVPHFIFMSSIIVYNDSDIVDGMITKDTIPYSKNAYGDSKIQAEKGILPLEDETFKIAILRPPMIYGPGSKGNYPKLAKLARITLIFPDYPNKRSMLFVDNLSATLNYVFTREKNGILHPQNPEYVSTSNMVKTISENSNRKIYLIGIMNPLIKIMARNRLVNKVFGNFAYENFDEQKSSVTNFVDSIKITESKI